MSSVLTLTGCGVQQGSGSALTSLFDLGVIDFDQPKTLTSIPVGRYSGFGDFVFTQTVLGEAQEFLPNDAPHLAIFGEEGEPLHNTDYYWPKAAGDVLFQDPVTGDPTHHILSVEATDEGVVVRTRVVWPITVEPLSLPAELTETYTMNPDGTLNYEATGSGSSEDGSVTISLRANFLLEDPFAPTG